MKMNHEVVIGLYHVSEFYSPSLERHVYVARHDEVLGAEITHACIPGCTERNVPSDEVLTKITEDPHSDGVTDGFIWQKTAWDDLSPGLREKLHSRVT